jgi:dolichol-phosphate mannosyltransferase
MSDKIISIVVPTFNEEGNVEALYKAVDSNLKTYEYEIIFVNDGSGDNSLNNVKTLASKHSQVKYIDFSRNFGHQAALRAGLKYASGDAVISMDADLQHPPELLPDLIKKWQEGYEVVYTLRKDTKETSFTKRFTSTWFYRVMNFMSGLHMEEGAADFRLLDRKVVDVINEQPEADLFLRGYINWIGFKQVGIPYTPAKRFSGTSKYTLKKMVSFASKGVTQFSIKPLRLAFSLALIAFLLSAIYVIYAIIANIVGHAVPGWLSLVILVVFLQGIQFLLIGLVGEYVGRTFIQTKHRPEYIVRETSVE